MRKRSAVRVRLNDPDSRYHQHEGTVASRDLEKAGKRPLTVHLADGHSTLAFADELEVIS